MTTKTHPPSEDLLILEQRIHRLRAILTFQAFALAVVFGGLLSLADWKITVVAWLICLFTMPRFARL